MAMTPVLDSVLTNYINAGKDSRASMIGYAQVAKMAENDRAVKGQMADDQEIFVGTLFREEDSNLSEQEVYDVVSKNVGGADVSSLEVKDGVPGSDGRNKCLSVAGTICMSYNVQKGYTTFYVKGSDVSSVDKDYHRKYAVADWGGDDSKLIVLDAETDEFLDLIEEPGSFGRHVENAYRVVMDETISVTITAPPFAEKTTYVSDGDEDIEVENINADPSEVVDKHLAVVLGEDASAGSVARDAGEETIDQEKIAALAGARGKGYVKDGGTVMMPEEEEAVDVLEVEPLFA